MPLASSLNLVLVTTTASQSNRVLAEKRPSGQSRGVIRGQAVLELLGVGLRPFLDTLFALDSCKNKFDFFIQTLSAAIDRYLPIKVSRMRSTDKPWLTPKIKVLIAKRQKALAQFGKDSPSFHMWRNKVQASIKTCKRSRTTARLKFGKARQNLVSKKKITVRTCITEMMTDFFLKINKSLTSAHGPLHRSPVTNHWPCIIN